MPASKLNTSLAAFAAIAGTTRQAASRYANPNEWLSYKLGRAIGRAPDPLEHARTIARDAAARLDALVADTAVTWGPQELARDLRVRWQRGDTLRSVVARYVVKLHGAIEGDTIDAATPDASADRGRADNEADA